MEVYRGDILFIRKGGYVEGSEQEAGRPAVVVSNNKNNVHSDVIEVVYLTTQEKSNLPTHVPIMCKVPSTALCEQVHSVYKDRVLEYVRSCTKEEMAEIDKALLISLDLKKTERYQIVGQEIKPIADDKELVRVSAERDVYKSLYMDLLDKTR